MKFNEANTLFDPIIKLMKNDRRAVAQLEYASPITTLMYLVHRKLDIIFVAGKLSKFTSNPSTEH